MPTFTGSTAISATITPPKTRTRRTLARVRFEEEIVTQIYGPRLVKLLSECLDITNTAMLARAFAEGHNCSVSPQTMQKWLNICELAPVQRAEWEGLEDVGRPQVLNQGETD